MAAQWSVWLSHHNLTLYLHMPRNELQPPSEHQPSQTLNKSRALTIKVVFHTKEPKPPDKSHLESTTGDIFSTNALSLALITSIFIGSFFLKSVAK
ncbi:hypothetical protein AcV7_009962 [Taiwanofungus camphoratus]|nr:hypothetical protein AcV7_009962 [Antrodia cinnamomea]